MASPFRTFRKHQKTLIAVAGVALMFVFVLGDPLSQYMRSHSGSATPEGHRPNDVAVHWDRGQLTNAELAHLVQQRLVVNAFVRQVEAVGREAAFRAGVQPQPLRVEMMVGPERIQQGVEHDVLRVHLFADAARKAGMAISDGHLVAYLQQLGRGYVSVEEIRQILRAMAVRGRGASQDFVFDGLREEMLARNYLASYIFAFDTNLPEQRWQDWLHVNDRVVVEAAAIPAESLLVDVPEPSEEELVAFFDEYKDDEPMPQPVMNIELPSPNPGFAEPRKVAVQYLMADYNQFLTKVEDEVTDAEIKKFYEDNKDPYFIRDESVLSEADDSLIEGKADNASTEEKADDSSTTDDSTAGETPDGNAAESAQPTDQDSKVGDSTDEDTNAEEKAAPATNEGSSNASGRKSPFRLTAFAEDAEAGDETAATSDAPNGSPDKPSESAATEAGEAPSAAENAAAPTADMAAPKEKPKSYQPLDELRDQIRRELAQAKVTEQLETLMATLSGELNDSYTEYFGAALVAEDEGKEPPPPPAKLADLTPLAKEYSLTYEKTEPASMLQFRDTPIGKSSRLDEGNLPYYYSVFGRDVELYQPIVTFDLDNNRYLSMKTADIPGKVPTLDEVRDKVVRAWKLRKAGELAIKRAEELAKKAQLSGASLEDALAGDKSLTVFKTDPFAYLTVGSVSRQSQQVDSFRLSEPKEIVAAGPDFMETVFNLKEGEVAAAPNHDRSVAYVVRIARHENTLPELRQAFLSEADSWYGLFALSRGRSQSIVRDLIAATLQSEGVEWDRPADVPMREQSEPGET